MTYLGLRPGEKLYEELLVKTEELDKTSNSMIFIERDSALSPKEINTRLNMLREVCETGDDSQATTIENPTYKVDGVLHYVVDHTPSLFHKTFTRNNSSVIIPYVEQLMLDNPGSVLENALLLKDGIVVDEEINRFQGR